MTLVETLKVTAEIYGKELSHAAAIVFLADLSAFPEERIIAALARCRRELKTFPSLSDILARVEDGRPGVEEGWALCPKSEFDSTVWTDEVREAYFSGAHELYAHDQIAARLAFKEKYSETLVQARASGKPIKWETSLGHDKAAQERVLLAAVARGRLTAPEAQKLLPDSSHRPEQGNARLIALSSSATKQIGND